MAKKPSQKNLGRVSQVIGAVVDVEHIRVYGCS